MTYLNKKVLYVFHIKRRMALSNDKITVVSSVWDAIDVLTTQWKTNQLLYYQLRAFQRHTPLHEAEKTIELEGNFRDILGDTLEWYIIINRDNRTLKEEKKKNYPITYTNETTLADIHQQILFLKKKHPQVLTLKETFPNITCIDFESKNITRGDLKKWSDLYTLNALQEISTHISHYLYGLNAIYWH